MIMRPASTSHWNASSLPKNSVKPVTTPAAAAMAQRTGEGRERVKRAVAKKAKSAP